MHSKVLISKRKSFYLICLFIIFQNISWMPGKAKWILCLLTFRNIVTPQTKFDPYNIFFVNIWCSFPTDLNSTYCSYEKYDFHDFPFLFLNHPPYLIFVTGHNHYIWQSIRKGPWGVLFTNNLGLSHIVV